MARARSTGGTRRVVGVGLTREDAIAVLEDAVVDVTRAVADMRSGPRDAEHYER